MGMCRAGGCVVLAEHHVALPLHAFNPPVGLPQFQQVSGCGLLRASEMTA